MNILYTCDNNYIWIMEISVISLFENNRSASELSVYLLGEKISDENKELLGNIAERYKRKIIVIDIPQFDIPEYLVSERWPLSAFTRLFSGILLPENIEKILYLDCDTIVNGNIMKLEDLEMKNNIFCGIKDCISAVYKKNIGLNDNDVYINAGVLLIDLKKLRAFDVNKAINEYMNKYTRVISYADQDILNGIFSGKIGYLQPQYNVMTIDAVHTYEQIQMLRKPTCFYSKEEMTNAVNDPKIIHYTTNMLVIRPWFRDSDHPFKKEFEKYMKMSTQGNLALKKMKLGNTAKIIKIIHVFPDKIAYRILGFIHAELKPRYVRMKAR